MARKPSQKNVSMHIHLAFFSLQCYYIGATSDAATKIINEVSKPMSHHIPVEKICEKLKKKDSQICELKYGELPAEGEMGAPSWGTELFWVKAY